MECHSRVFSTLLKCLLLTNHLPSGKHSNGISPFVKGNTSSIRVQFPTSYVRLPGCNKKKTNGSTKIPSQKIPIRKIHSLTFQVTSYLPEGYLIGVVTSVIRHPSSESPNRRLHRHLHVTDQRCYQLRCQSRFGAHLRQSATAGLRK